MVSVMHISWAARCVAYIILASVATCTAIHTHKPLQKRQAGGGGIVSGIAWRDANGQVPIRREIHDLKDNYPDQWNLYLLGLSALQNTDQNDPLSFYGIAGIHGRPFKVWQDAPGLPHKIGTASYCPHGNTLFFGWHRPYLALFEQTLYEHIQKIVVNAPADQTERYRSSADSFRMPYWDWGLGEKGGPVPDYFMTPTITVRDVDGSEKTIKNPLYSYQFHPLVPGDFEQKWAHMNETSRWPENEDDPYAPSRNNMFADDFIGLQRAYVDGLEKTFREEDFNSFGQQLEQIHGWIHGTVAGGYYEEKGGRGHMWPLDYSSYEPVFWLHHTNVDRLFALYQAQHPDRYITPRNVFSNGNVFIDDDSIVDADTPLLPFRKDASHFWTTNDVRDTTVFGYTYPEIQPWNYPSEPEYQAAVSATVTQLYGGSMRDRLAGQSAKIAGARLGNGIANDTFTDWAISTRASASNLPPTFVARFFLAAKDTSESQVDVGKWSVLMPAQHGEKTTTNEKATHAQVQEKILKGNVGLTATLLDRVDAGELSSLQPEDVVPFLKDRLDWKMYSGNGRLMPQSKLDAMEVLVVSTSAHVLADPDSPVEYEGVNTPYPEVTAGKRGGGSGGNSSSGAV